jgi:hypothetical protein
MCWENENDLNHIINLIPSKSKDLRPRQDESRIDLNKY